MANDALFQELAKALARPSGAYRAAEAALAIPGQAVQGYSDVMSKKAAATEAKLKPYEIYTKIADTAGRNTADAIFKQNGLQVPQLNRTPAASGSPTGVTNLADQFNSGDIGGKELDRGIKLQGAATSFEQNRPRRPGEVMPNLIQSGMKPEEAQAWITANTNPDGTVSNRNYDDLTKALTARGANARGGFYSAKAGQLGLDELPSRSGPNTAAGASYQVLLGSRQGQALVANPLTSPQKLGLAAGDLSRSVMRAAPQLDAYRGADYSNTLTNKLNRITQTLTSGAYKPEDVPVIRKELYTIFKDLRDSSRPFIANHLSNMESFLPENLPADWNGVKSRELGDNIPEIPFQETAGPSGSKTYQKTATNKQGVTIGTNDNWATFEPVQQ